MTNININDEIHEEWKAHYKKQDKIKYPTLKNFTEQKLKEIIDKK